MKNDDNVRHHCLSFKDVSVSQVSDKLPQIFTIHLNIVYDADVVQSRVKEAFDYIDLLY